MANNKNSKKLNETFGQYDASDNVNMTMSQNSEDDKPQPKHIDLSLSNDGIGNNDSPIQMPDDQTTAKQNAFSDHVVNSMNHHKEAPNIDTTYSISPDSEDDKPQPKHIDLSLSNDGIGNNDSPVQNANDIVTPEQQRISDEILAEEKKINIMNEQVKENLDTMQKNVESYIDEAKKQYEEEGGLKGMAQEKIADLKKSMDTDPKGTLCDLGKNALIVIGALTVIKKLLFRK
ncbi:hypothetical protein C815_00266 [Firmicutes bacterium M10-2]|nr:hypothetical protein C815_00266 [Firmicutes bacterium M10-2]